MHPGDMSGAIVSQRLPSRLSQLGGSRRLHCDARQRAPAASAERPPGCEPSCRHTKTARLDSATQRRPQLRPVVCRSLAVAVAVVVVFVESSRGLLLFLASRGRRRVGGARRKRGARASSCGPTASERQNNNNV